MRFVLSSCSVVLILAAAACKPSVPDSPEFSCESFGDAGAPDGSCNGTCVALPPDASGCGDIPGLFGHPPVENDASYQNGCVVTLPYGNPFYNGTAQQCFCQTTGVADGATTTQWACGI
jgi:hypothetical protein